MQKIRLALFGTPDYSLIIFEKLREAGFPIVLVVTKPERPVGREKIMTPTPVADWAKKHNLPLYTPTSHPEKPWQFAHPDELTNTLAMAKPDLLVTADYTQFIPMKLVEQIKYGGLNVHPSLLPAYRGPAPVPWAILHGETETGVSLVTLSEQFDAGKIVAQTKEPILPTDTTHTLLTRLFDKGADLLLQTLPNYMQQPSQILQQYNNETIKQSSYFPRLTRDHGFESWEHVKKAIESGTQAARIERKWRALHPWPGIWTEVIYQGIKKRLKLLKLHLQQTIEQSNNETMLILDEIQLEGKTPVRGQDVEGIIKSLK